MTNKTKDIEEAAKLPTAYQSAQEHNAVDKYGKPQSEVLAAIESHTAAHTAALRDQISDLERENNNYRIVYDSVVKNRDELRERVKELEVKLELAESDEPFWKSELGLSEARIKELNNRVEELESLMQEFVDRVDRGEVRSKKTYAKFKEALK